MIASQLRWTSKSVDLLFGGGERHATDMMENDSLCGEQEDFEGGSHKRSLRKCWVMFAHDARSLFVLSRSWGWPHDLVSVGLVKVDLDTSHDEKEIGSCSFLDMRWFVQAHVPTKTP